MDTTALPFERTHPLRVPPLLRELQSRGPVHAVRTPVGDPAWLVTDYAEVKRLLAGDVLGRSHPDPDRAARIGESVLVSGPLGNYATEPQDSARTRALLQPHFSPKRIRELRDRVDVLATELVDALADRERPVDLVEALALPLPVLVVCELLGVPYAERAEFRAWIHAAADVTDRAGSARAVDALYRYCQDLVARKHADPGDDITSRLCGTEGVDDAETAYYTMVLLFAGFETTSVHIGYGMLLFLLNPDQWRIIVADPDVIPNAVDELIRATPGPAGGDIPRYARKDFQLDAVSIREGDLVLLDNGAANHDPDAFPEPDRFDVGREAGGHLSFGHGPHYCIGAPLAKVELETVFRKLVDRFPRMRLAADVEELRVHRNTQTGGLVELPVTW
ncbi:cytochrome P450 [Saccharopolyspora cebuensis]|uniref:Cytochrome P450 n=1 Tax=Saccharopolyspora cebuensis TaxID=418759 RepID=A0ABV4CIV5_9PSEU